MLELKNINKTYKTKSGDTHALVDVSLVFEEKGLVFINGKSGSGKTTLLNVIGGLDGVDSGEIIVDGKSFSSFTESEYDDYRNTYVGFIFQEYNLLSDFSVGKNIEIASELQGKEVGKDQVKNLLENFEISEYLNRDVTELSGGQKQRVAIARAIIKSPKIIIADEPTGALDSQTGSQVIELLKKLSSKTLVIVVSHDLELAKNYADRIISLKDGRIVNDVTLTDVDVDGAVYQTENGLVVRSGARLTESELKSLSDAVYDKKNIEITDKISVREQVKTKVSVADKQLSPLKLVKSKMKFKSSFSLGAKFLKVKPIRLIITILLSVIAFSVFGLFSTVASYNQAKIVASTLRSSGYGGVSIYGNYVGGREGDYDVRVSDDTIKDVSKTTGFKFRGVYDIDDGATGQNDVKSIYELSSHQLSGGRYYYYKTVNGFVEFKKSEINGNIVDKNGFNYKVIYGEYPKTFEQVGISNYLAESIMTFAKNRGGAYGNVTINEVQDLIGQSISFYSPTVSFKISAIIDCGKINNKYDQLKQEKYSTEYGTLISDFNTYLNNGLYTSLFVGEGFVENYRAKNNRQVLYSGIPASYNMKFQEKQTGNFIGSNYFYAGDKINKDNLLLFNGASVEDFDLKDGQTIISANNLKYIYRDERATISDQERQIMENYLNVITGKSYTQGDRQNALDGLTELIVNSADGYDGQFKYKKLTVTQTASESKDRVAFDFDVVGVYFNLDTDFRVNEWLPIAITFNDMNGFGVYTGQGYYARMVAPLNTSRRACNALSKVMSGIDGLKFNMYENAVYEILEEGEKIVSQVSNLFLYLSIALEAFSILMLFNYISASIVAKRQSIGVLKGLGASKRDIFIMFIIESVILSLIIGVLSIGVSYAGCYFVNYYVKEIMNISINFVIFELKQVIVIILSSLITGVASSILPIIKITKEKPVNLIRKN